MFTFDSEIRFWESGNQLLVRGANVVIRSLVTGFGTQIAHRLLSPEPLFLGEVRLLPDRPWDSKLDEAGVTSW